MVRGVNHLPDGRSDLPNQPSRQPWGYGRRIPVMSGLQGLLSSAAARSSSPHTSSRWISPGRLRQPQHAKPLPRRSAFGWRFDWSNGSMFRFRGVGWWRSGPPSGPLDPLCDCLVCATYSRAMLHSICTKEPVCVSLCEWPGGWLWCRLANGQLRPRLFWRISNLALKDSFDRCGYCTG